MWGIDRRRHGAGGATSSPRRGIGHDRAADLAIRRRGTARCAHARPRSLLRYGRPVEAPPTSGPDPSKNSNVVVTVEVSRDSDGDDEARSRLRAALLMVRPASLASSHKLYLGGTHTVATDSVPDSRRLRALGFVSNHATESSERKLRHHQIYGQLPGRRKERPDASAMSDRCRGSRERVEQVPLFDRPRMTEHRHLSRKLLTRRRTADAPSSDREALHQR